MESVAEKVRSLPPDKQLRVLDYVEDLQPKARAPQPLRSLEGLWADLGVDITEDDIAEARKEMWG